LATTRVVVVVVGVPLFRPVLDGGVAGDIASTQTGAGKSTTVESRRNARTNGLLSP